jgi:hypothetical protein
MAWPSEYKKLYEVFIMNLIGQAKRSRAHILWLLIVLLTVSCGASEEPESTTVGITPTLPPPQIVEYGASLSEWEEATQTESSASASLGETLDPSGYPVQDSPQVAASGYPGPVSEVIQPEDGYPEPVSEVIRPEDGYPGPENPTSAPEVEVDNAATERLDTATRFTLNGIAYQEILWDALVPPEFTPEAIMSKYEDQLAQFEDGSPDAFEIYTQMQEEFNNAPVNELINGELVRLPGFIAPLEYTDELITEFLLVPYFGACIHVPPPPANQTVLVKTAEGQGIKFEDSYSPFWVMGEMTAEGTTTDLAQAGYYVENALVELYVDSP